MRKLADMFLHDVGVPFKDKGNYIVMHYTVLFTSTVLSSMLSMDNVKLFNATTLKNLIIRLLLTDGDSDNLNGGSIVTSNNEGVVWAASVIKNCTLIPIHYNNQSYIDPNTINTPVVMLTMGYDGPFSAFSVNYLV